MPDTPTEGAVWTIRADGPDGRVDHFYADTDLSELEVVPLSRALEAEASPASDSLSAEDQLYATNLCYVETCRELKEAQARAEAAEQALREAVETVEQMQLRAESYQLDDRHRDGLVHLLRSIHALAERLGPTEGKG